MLAPDLEELLAFAVALALKAGKQIASASLTRASDSTTLTADASKKNRVDLVTATDQAVEKFVMDEIKSKYPEHSFIGEESFAAGARGELTNEPTWIVDPIDGTTNFVHGFDMVCISIGFTYQKKPVVGVIYNPFLDKLFSARKGHGAWLNQTTQLPLSHPSPPALASLSDACIGVEWGSDRSPKVVEAKINTFRKLISEQGVMAHSLRSLGSAALNFAYVAAGQIDVYHEIGCHSWDVCAGVIIAQEAGAKVYGRTGKEWEDDDLMMHHYAVIRAVGDTSSEKGGAAQDRLIKSYFEVAEEYDV